MPLTQVKTSNLDTTNSLFFRNRIINGAMTIAQRGTSVTGFTSGQLRTCDRIGAYVNTATWTGTQSTDAPAGFSNSFRIECTTANATIGVGDQVQFFYNIEDRDLQDFAKGTASSSSFTVSFWVKSNKTGTSVLNIQDANTRHVNKSYTINSANTWEYKTLSFTGDTSGTMTNNNSGGLLLEFWFRVGSNNSSGSIQNNWTSYSAVNRAVGTNLNLGTSNGDYVCMTGLQLEKGTAATAFEYRPFGTELQLCQRYYHFLGGDTAYQSINTVVWYGSTDAAGFFRHPVEMRAAPTIAKTGNWTTLGSGGTVSQTINADQNGPKTTQFGFAGGSGGTSGQATLIRVNNDNNFRLTFSSEL
jgi:hypothetical protein